MYEKAKILLERSLKIKEKENIKIQQINDSNGEKKKKWIFLKNQ